MNDISRNSVHMSRKTTQSITETARTDLEEARLVRAQALRDIEECDLKARTKHIDAWTRAANVVRALEKDRKRALREFTDDELAEYIRSLPERRRDALLVAVQGTSLNGKPLF